MKKTFVRLSLALLAIIGLAIFAGIIPVVTGIVALVCVQAVAFAVAAPTPALFNTVLTPEQIKEFGEILDGLKEYKTVFPSLKGLDFEQLKGLPAGFKSINDIVDKIKGDMDVFRKAQLNQKSSAPKRKGEVSDDCARQLGAIALLLGVKQDKLEGISRDNAAGLYKEITGVELKAALTSSDIPLPIVYSGDVAELVGQFGAARQYGTVFPLGGAAVRLPRLTTDPTFNLIAGSATVTEKSPQAAFVSFNAEKFGGLIRLPSEMDADSIIPIGQFLARYAARQLAYVEDYQVFRSTGAASGLNGTAEGLTKNTITNSKVTQMASTKTKFSDMTLANARTLRTVCDAAALRMGAYYFHPSFEQAFAAMNTAGDKPYQANGLGGATLDGFPIRWVDVMPVYSTSNNVSTVFGLFGDLSFQYLGVRGGIRFDTSLEAGFTTDEILVRAVERLTTGLMATGAVGGIQTAAS